ncbi:MAG: cytochrome c oxidase accessory protein CcoG [Saprospiraceae bacterium]|nr:MAG: cytochrome c oxidase accessory protein CcoG [Bacteroidetes bacterium OLB9]MCO6463601.1 cytochrome c oxidase accessory protein CcoG [Saprospiraceae bacterium]MCZ2337996.1 cytochrome c oxidase accessory protein CcoG [Chitinophagales bacterium]
MSVVKKPENKESQFRDKLATVDSKGKRIWVYPKKPKGRYTNYRTWLSYVYFLILFGLPFIKLNGEPLVLLNIPERNFIIFGMHFGPQDFYLFAIGMLILLVFIILFTVVYGRLFCGWICPQTVFLELMFRRIEYAIEGDHNEQRKLSVAPWDTNKIIKKVSKHIIFFVLSVIIANTFLAYIIGIDEVKKIITEPLSQHFGGFAAMLIFSAVFYYVFASLREQVCITICPYGRLQGVMLDDKSLVVAYDFVRGEPRGKIKKSMAKPAPLAATSVKTTAANADVSQDYFDSMKEQVLGDCIDCSLCVQVCPTGIDIRNGTQLECVNCTACMDACDEVMDKIERPRGLIRLDSIEGITQGKRHIFNARTIGYSVVLFVLIGIEVLLFALRSDVDVLFLRAGGLLNQRNEDGTISNLYNYQLDNKTSKDLHIEFKLLDPAVGTFEFVGNVQPEVAKNSHGKGTVFIKIPEEKLESGKNKIVIGVYSDGELITKVKTTFFGPIK